MSVLTGCLFGADGDDKGKAKSKAKNKAVASAPKLGGKGTACEMPVRFELAKSWKPKAVDISANEELAPLGQQGPVTLVCEIDAKPAGNIGFLRVWTGNKGAAAKGGDPRALLTAFLDDQAGVRDAKYRGIKAGELGAMEVRYTFEDPSLDESKPERALAVMTARGGVVVHLGGLDAQEHEAMLPAYELAKKTMESTT